MRGFSILLVVFQTCTRLFIITAIPFVLFFTAFVVYAQPPRQKALTEANHYLAHLGPVPVSTDPVLADNIMDPFIAYLANLIEHSRYGTVGQAHFEMAIDAKGRKTFIPYNLIREVQRSPGKAAGRGWLRLTLTKSHRIPVGYKILGFRPGAVVISQEATFEEWRFHRLRIPYVTKHKKRKRHKRHIIIENVTLWGLLDGEILMDLSLFLETLLLKTVDDTYIIGFALFQYQGTPYVAALGFGKNGTKRSGFLNIKTNKICFPSTSEQKAMGRYLRAKAIHLMARRGIQVKQQKQK